MLAWPPAFLMQGHDSAFSCLANFGWGKIRQTLSVLNLAKILLNYSFFYIGGGEKFIKGVCRMGEGKRIKDAA